MLWAFYSRQEPTRHVLGVRNVPLLEFLDECQQHVGRAWDHAGMRLLCEVAKQAVGRRQARVVTAGEREAIQQLRGALRELGSPRQLRRLPAARESLQVERLRAIADRLNQPGCVPGMTVHQAKGKEWGAVGARFKPGTTVPVRDVALG